MRRRIPSNDKRQGNNRFGCSNRTFVAWLAGSALLLACFMSACDPDAGPEGEGGGSSSSENGGSESGLHCSADEYQTMLQEAREAWSDNVGPIPDGCYPTDLSGTVTFISSFSDPDVSSIDVEFSGGEIVAIDGAACDALYPDQASTIHSCQKRFKCGCCTMDYSGDLEAGEYELEFILATSADACDGLVFSGDFEYTEPTVDTGGGNDECGGYEPCCEDCSTDCEWCGTDMGCFQSCYGDCMSCCRQCY